MTSSQSTGTVLERHLEGRRSSGRRGYGRTASGRLRPPFLNLPRLSRPWVERDPVLRGGPDPSGRFPHLRGRPAVGSTTAGRAARSAPTSSVVATIVRPFC